MLLCPEIAESDFCDITLLAENKVNFVFQLTGNVSLITVNALCENVDKVITSCSCSAHCILEHNMVVFNRA